MATPIFLVVGWYHMIPKAWRALAPAYGLHASLLPDYSGGTPLVWAMINGETKTGITLLQMNDGVNSGPIAGQSKEPIHPTDTIATLYSRIGARAGVVATRLACPGGWNAHTQAARREQTSHHAPARTRGWAHRLGAGCAIAIDRFVCAQALPYPGAFSTLDGEQFTIWAGRCESESQQEKTPGLVQKEGSSYAVVCAQGRFKLKEVTYGGRDYSQSQLPELLGGGDRGWALSRAA